MRANILTKKQFANTIDECIKDTENKGGAKLQNLGNFCRFLGEATKNDVLISLAFPLGQLGYHYSWFMTSPTVTMLTPDIKRRYEKLLDQTSKDVLSALERLKTELCGRNRERPKEIIKIISIFDQRWMKLAEEMDTLTSLQPESQG